MQHFTAPGIWYTAKDPDRQARGTIHISEDGVLLEIFGSFSEETEGFHISSTPYERIYGVVGRTPYGGYVTLLNAYTEQKKISFLGVGSEIVRSNRGVVGNCQLLPENDRMSSLHLSLTYLADWFGRTGISSTFIPGNEGGTDVRYRSAEPFIFNVGDLTVTIGSSARRRESFHSTTIHETAHIIVDGLPKLELFDAHHKYISPLNNLLSFATDTPNGIEEITFEGENLDDSGSDEKQRYHPIYEPIFKARTKEECSRRYPHEMLFTLREATQFLPNLIGSWLEFSAKHAGFCSVYFGFVHAPPAFLEQKFLELMSAVKLFCASTGAASSRSIHLAGEIQTLVASYFAPEEMAILHRSLPTGSEIETPLFILRGLERHHALMARIVGTDFPAFVSSVFEHLEFVERRGEMPANRYTEKNPLYAVAQKVLVLVKVLVLDELGFETEVIAKFINRNNFISQMKSFL